MKTQQTAHDRMRRNLPPRSLEEAEEMRAIAGRAGKKAVQRLLSSVAQTLHPRRESPEWFPRLFGHIPEECDNLCPLAVSILLRANFDEAEQAIRIKLNAVQRQARTRKLYMGDIVSLLNEAKEKGFAMTEPVKVANSYGYRIKATVAVVATTPDFFYLGIERPEGGTRVAVVNAWPGLAYFTRLDPERKKSMLQLWRTENAEDLVRINRWNPTS